MEITKLGEYLDPTDAAKLRGVSPQTIAKWMDKGLPYTQYKPNQPRYVHIDDLMEFEARAPGRPKKK